MSAFDQWKARLEVEAAGHGDSDPAEASMYRETGESNIASNSQVLLEEFRKRHPEQGRKAKAREGGTGDAWASPLPPSGYKPGPRGGVTSRREAD